MKQLFLDATNWNNANDVYDDFFHAVGAPSWQGRNFDALRDSIETGQINVVEVPYHIVIRNSGQADAEAKRFLADFVVLIRQLASNGCPVAIDLYD